MSAVVSLPKNHECWLHCHSQRSTLSSRPGSAENAFGLSACKHSSLLCALPIYLTDFCERFVLMKLTAGSNVALMSRQPNANAGATVVVCMYVCYMCSRNHKWMKNQQLLNPLEWKILNHLLIDVHNFEVISNFY